MRLSEIDSTPANDSERPLKPQRAVVLLVLLVFLGLLATAGVKSYRDLQATLRHEAELAEQIEQTQVHIDELKRRAQMLQEDPAALERLAREELTMVYPDEIVIMLPAQ